jgi:type VI secretion system secreted protein Hcp
MPVYMNVTRNKVQVVRGTVKKKGHEGWVELQSAQFGGQRSVSSGTGRGANREANAPSISEMVVTKVQDEASTALFRESLQGTGVQVTIDFTKADGADESIFMSITLQDTLISSYNVSGHGGDTTGKPMESLSLNFTKITFDTQGKGPDISTTVWGHTATAQP